MIPPIRDAGRRERLAKAAVVVLSAAMLVGGLGGYVLMRNGAFSSSPDELVRDVVESEELILDLSPRLGGLSKGLMNLKLPSRPAADDLFAEKVLITDLRPPEGTPAETAISQSRVLPAGAARETDRKNLSLWEPLLETVDYFEHAKFKFVRGNFAGQGREQFESVIKFGGLARETSGGWASFSGSHEVTWSKGSDGTWRIAAWRSGPMKVAAAAKRLFSERLAEALPNTEDFARATYPKHEIESVKYFQSGMTRALSHDFAPIAMNQKPALSVVDIDGDGFDDLYVMVRLGKNLLLRNRGDGTFEERAADRELAAPGNSTCGIFADFDNDGDPDLMLGRSVERSAYLENTGLWFREVEQPAPLPALVVSMAAADFNGDGLLDLYVATYRPEALGEVSPNFGEQAGQGDDPWPDRFLSPEDAAEFRRQYRKETSGPERSFLNQVGPPNVLLVNRGGGQFEPAAETTIPRLWKNTLQATWADYDEDGDPDLYLANDWAPDHLFRNDGHGRLEDVTAEAGVDVYGFGMGASFGDYDQDGRQDLYVTNMFSKAGRRILARFEGVDDDYLKSVEGNVLYRAAPGGKFTQVSGLEPPALMVAEAGWSWGGQFADFDNDTDLDIYALSGYFTAPAAVASDVDL